MYSNFFFGPWVTIVGLLALSFVSARKVLRCFQFRSRKDNVSASSNTAGSYFSAGLSSHESSSSSSSSFSNSGDVTDVFFENIFLLRL